MMLFQIRHAATTSAIVQKRVVVLLRIVAAQPFDDRIWASIYSRHQCIARKDKVPLGPTYEIISENISRIDIRLMSIRRFQRRIDVYPISMRASNPTMLIK